MDFSMADTGKGYKIFFHIPSELAAPLHMLNLQICREGGSRDSRAERLLRLAGGSCWQDTAIRDQELFPTGTNETQCRLRPTNCSGGCSWSSQR
jgi:hypothetical protein